MSATVQPVAYRMTHEKRKQSLYFPDGMVSEIHAEARRLDRSMSWVMQRAWRVAQASIAQMPSADGEASG